MNKEGFNNIVLACSGASNTGSYSDIVARKLMNLGEAKMLCLARFAVDEQFSIQAKEQMPEYENLIVVDGCKINCAAKMISKIGVDDYRHFSITDFGVQKGKTEVTEKKINEIIENIIENYK